MPDGSGMMAGRILVVEDQEDNRRILRDLFTAAGYEVLEALTGEDGVRLALEAQADLVVMDVQLPGIDGYAATRQLKAQRPALPILVVTSYALSGEEATARAAGADGYVAKPFSPRALLAQGRTYLPYAPRRRPRPTW